MIYLTAKGENENLETAGEIVLTTMARARNTGMVFNSEENIVLEPGSAPVVLEPVKAKIEVPFKGNLLVLNHDGTSAVSERKIKKQIVIDGSSDKTPFFLIQK